MSSTPAEATVEISGWRMTGPRMAPQTRDSVRRCMRLPMNGMRPRSTPSPTLESMAGRTVIEPIMAIRTTTIEPVASPVNSASPAKYRPAMAVMTVRPEMSTVRPDVAAAAASASSLLLPALRSSRSRRM